jgi:hypothetical protein
MIKKKLSDFLVRVFDGVSDVDRRNTPLQIQPQILYSIQLRRQRRQRTIVIERRLSPVTNGKSHAMSSAALVPG